MLGYQSPVHLQYSLNTSYLSNTMLDAEDTHSPCIYELGGYGGYNSGKQFSKTHVKTKSTES